MVRFSLKTVLITLLCTVAWAFEPAHRIDIDCSDCHNIHDGPLLSREVEQEFMCKTCHNPMGRANWLSDVANHTVDNGARIIDCGSCHNPHYRMSPVANPSSLADYNLSLVRTDTAKYVDGALEPVCLLIRPDDLAFYPPASPDNAICQTCHTSTEHHRNSGPSETAHDYEDCVFCHAHDEGFSPVFPEHSATPGNGTVIIHADNHHDDAGWTGSKPYFDVAVDCDTCHDSDLLAVHGASSGNNCAVCHPSPFDTLGTWGGGCQQGGCHAAYHEDSTAAHLPFEDPYDPENDCDLCHTQNIGPVTQTQCLNCHASHGPGDSTPPLTSSDALASYIGTARIGFSIRDNGGKVGLGMTFARLDGNPESAGSEIIVSAPGDHALEFWSIDQSGNIESPAQWAYFTITPDTEPPSTTSNSAAHYYNGGTITLTATDNGTEGVKTTYYRLNGGPIQTGTRISLPATSGVIEYTLLFWSEDWSGNVEAQNSADFTVTSGNGILRLVWGTSDDTGSPCPDDPEAWASWTVKRGAAIVATGSGACPNWDGVDDVSVPVSPTAYSVSIDWWDSRWGWDDNTYYPDISVTTPGQIIKLPY